MFARDVSGDGARARALADKRLEDIGVQLELAAERAAPNPDTWGLSPAAIEAQEQAIKLSGGGDA